MKRSTTLYVDGELIEAAKRAGMNISQTLNDALIQSLRTNTAPEETDYDVNKAKSEAAYQKWLKEREQNKEKEERVKWDAMTEEEKENFIKERNAKELAKRRKEDDIYEKETLRTG